MLLKSIKELMAPQASRAYYFLYYALGTVVGIGCCWFIAGFSEEETFPNAGQEQLLSVDSVRSSFQMPLPKAIDISKEGSSDSTSFAMQ